MTMRPGKNLSAIREQILAGEDFGDIARRESDDPGSAPSGGELGWNGPNTFVPEFNARFWPASSRASSVSHFAHSSAGTSCSCIDPGSATPRRIHRKNQAFMAIRARKADEEMQVFVRRLRDEAYVDIRL